MPQRAPKPAPLPRVPGEPRVPAAGPVPLGALHPVKGQEGRRGRAREVQWAISVFSRNLPPRQSPHRSQGEFFFREGWLRTGGLSRPVTAVCRLLVHRAVSLPATAFFC